jgi:hypothetical protein
VLYVVERTASARFGRQPNLASSGEIPGKELVENPRHRNSSRRPGTSTASLPTLARSVHLLGMSLPSEDLGDVVLSF